MMANGIWIAEERWYKGCGRKKISVVFGFKYTEFFKNGISWYSRIPISVWYSMGLLNSGTLLHWGFQGASLTCHALCPTWFHLPHSDSAYCWLPEQTTKEGESAVIFTKVGSSSSSSSSGGDRLSHCNLLQPCSHPHVRQLLDPGLAFIQCCCSSQEQQLRTN